MFKGNKLVKGVIIGLSSLTMLGTGLGATNAYNKATTLPQVEEVEKTDKQKLAIDLATSESYKEMLERSKKEREKASKKQMEKIIKDLEEKEKKEKKAKEKAEKEAQQKLEQEQEEARIQEEQRVLAEQQAQLEQEIQQEQVQEPVQQVAEPVQQEVQAPKQEPQQRTDGFNYNGNHYNISTFSGSGDVPHWTNSVFQWSDYPKHWLIERQSYAGQTINGLSVGSQVVKDGQTFTVYDIAYNQDRKVAQSLVYNNDATMTIQVCATDDALSNLHIYFLK